MDLDLSLFRPVYSPKVRKVGQSEGENVFNVQDFLEVLAQLHSPNHAPHGASQLGRPFGLIQVSFKLFYQASDQGISDTFLIVNNSQLRDSPLLLVCVLNHHMKDDYPRFPSRLPL